MDRRRHPCGDEHALHNGEPILPAMPAAICDARGRLDWDGSAKVDDRLIAALAAAGVPIRRSRLPHGLHLGRINIPIQRKLRVIDASTGFTAGMGIGPQSTGHAQDPAHGLGSHCQVEGRVLAQLQSEFIDNRIEATAMCCTARPAWPRSSPAASQRHRCSATRPVAAAGARKR